MAFLLAAPFFIEGAPYVPDLKEQVSYLRNDLKNLEVEFRQLKEHVANQDTTLDVVQEEMTASAESQKNQTLHTRMENLLAEVETIKKHINQLTDAVDANRRKNLEAESRSQSIQTALNAVSDALGIESPSSTVYTVKPGDSLGSIAQKNRTTISKLKKANNLKSDKIIVGQKLTLP